MNKFSFLTRSKSLTHRQPKVEKGPVNEKVWNGKILRNKARATVVAALEFREKVGGADQQAAKDLGDSARKAHDVCDYYAYFLTQAESDLIANALGLNDDDRRGFAELRKSLRNDWGYNRELLWVFCKKMEGLKRYPKKYAGLVKLSKGLASAESRLRKGDHAAEDVEHIKDWSIRPAPFAGKIRALKYTDGIVLRRPDMAIFKKAILKINPRSVWVLSKCEDKLRAQYREALSRTPAGRGVVIYSLATPSVKKYFPHLDEAVMYEEAMRFLALNPKASVYMDSPTPAPVDHDVVDAALEELLREFDSSN